MRWLLLIGLCVRYLWLCYLSQNACIILYSSWQSAGGCVVCMHTVIRRAWNAFDAVVVPSQRNAAKENHYTHSACLAAILWLWVIGALSAVLIGFCAPTCTHRHTWDLSEATLIGVLLCGNQYGCVVM